MALIEEPDYNREVPLEEVEEGGSENTVIVDGVEYEFLAAGYECTACDKRQVTDNGWHVGHVAALHTQGSDHEPEYFVLIGQEVDDG